MKEGKHISYTAVVLDEKSRERLIGMFNPPEGWETVCHHMTINLGPAKKGPAADMVGRDVSMTIDGAAVSYDPGVLAVKVRTDVPSNNDVKHITVAINRAGGATPKDSKKLTGWMPMPRVNLSGVVTEIPL